MQHAPLTKLTSNHLMREAAGFTAMAAKAKPRRRSACWKIWPLGTANWQPAVRPLHAWEMTIQQPLALTIERLIQGIGNGQPPG